jgi:enoyl-CoA hydratase/carnithine racemase
MPQIAIAAIHGAAVGIGAELAAACDLRIGTPNAKLSLPELRAGLFFTNGVLHRLPRLIGLARASDWMLTGRMVHADELLASGFVSRLVAPDSLLATALELADHMAGYDAAATRRAKALLAQTWELDLETAMRLEVEAMAAALWRGDRH